MRQDWIDYAKGLGIFLVVYGHSLDSATHAGLALSESFQLLSGATFSNVIPTFFFLSGLFVERSYDKRGALGLLGERLLRLAYPYFVWSLLQATAEIMFPAASQHGVTYDTLLSIPFRPFEQFWFLYALFLVYPAYALVRRTGRWSSVVLAFAAALLLLLPIPASAMALDLFSVHLIFFAGGVLFSRYFVGSHPLRIPLWVTAMSTALFFASSLFVFTQDIDPATALATHVQHRFYYAYLGTLCGVSCIGWAQLLASRNWLSLVRIMGVYSLPIYVAHMFFSVGFRVVAVRTFGGAEPVLILMGAIIAGIAGPIGLFLMTRWSGFPNLFELPQPVRLPRFRAPG